MRLIVLLYLISVILVFKSGCLLLVKFISSFFLFIQLFRISLNPMPYPSCTELHFISDKWILLQAEADPIIFSRAKILIDAGIFFLISFTSDNQRKLLVIFLDQLPENDCRLLKMIIQLS